MTTDEIEAQLEAFGIALRVLLMGMSPLSPLRKRASDALRAHEDKLREEGAAEALGAARRARKAMGL